MEADFPGLFRDMVELWRFIGPTGHAAVLLGVMASLFLATLRSFAIQLFAELRAKPTDAQRDSKWKVPALEK